MKQITWIFTCLYILAAIFIGFFSAYGNSSTLFKVALFYPLFSIAVFWVVYLFLQRFETKYKEKILVFFGLALLLIAFFAFRISDAIEKFRVTNTKVWDVQDEILLSQNGNPIGIRIRYNIQVPMSQREGVGVALFPISPNFNKNGLSLKNVVGETKNPSSNGFRGGVAYHMISDLRPDYVYWDGEGAWCYSYEYHDKTLLNLIEEFKNSDKKIKTQFRILIYLYVNPSKGGDNLYQEFDGVLAPGIVYQGITKNLYSPEEFYESAVKEGLYECPKLLFEAIEP